MGMICALLEAGNLLEDMANLLPIHGMMEPRHSGTENISHLTWYSEESWPSGTRHIVVS